MEFTIDLTDLQPSQLYLNRNKLRELIMDGFDGDTIQNHPLSVIKYHGELVLIDRHTEAFLADQQGLKTIRVQYIAEVDHLFVYQTRIQWCKAEDITRVTDLGKQILGDEDFQREWVSRCKEIKKYPLT